MNQWGRWDFAALSANVKKVTIKLNLTEGYTIALKLDDSGNNYGNINGNIQYKATVNGELIVTWDLEALNMDPTKIIKLVFWVYDSDQSVTTASFDLVSLTTE